MISLTDYPDNLVWCESIGEPHDKEQTDPYGEGPLYDNMLDEYERTNPAWTFHREPIHGHGGNLWHYTCPGPHYKLWQGAKVG
jgi:hypothetical protein